MKPIEVAVVIAMLLVASAIAGTGDYTTQLEAERDQLRQQVSGLRQQVASLYDNSQVCTRLVQHGDQ